jgi:hypothetical protein
VRVCIYGFTEACWMDVPNIAAVAHACSVSACLCCSAIQCSAIRLLLLFWLLPPSLPTIPIPNPFACFLARLVLTGFGFAFAFASPRMIAIPFIFDLFLQWAFVLCLGEKLLLSQASYFVPKKQRSCCSRQTGQDRCLCNWTLQIPQNGEGPFCLFML